MSYIENPKTKGSGIYCAIPQEYEPCRRNCKNCFYQGGRSYLEPLAQNLPNMPPKEILDNFVIRVNDGLDSCQNVYDVIDKTRNIPNKFYNTASYAPYLFNLLSECGPYVLTLNPGDMTDDEIYYPFIQMNHKPMAVRFRANMWNRDLLNVAIQLWCKDFGVPLIITFMRYYEEDPHIKKYPAYYNKKEHILNPSWSVNDAGWSNISVLYWTYDLVFTCGAGPDLHLCKDCGICLQLYWQDMVKRYEQNF